MNAAILTLENVTLTYPGAVTALKNLSITFARGQHTAVMGRNGSGKTSLFALLNGLLRPQSGAILFAGNRLSYDRTSLLRLRQAVGMVFQDPDHQLFSSSLYEDVSFGPMNLGLPEAEVRNRVKRALELLDLIPLVERPVHDLSFGQKKRACIAGILAMQPEVIVLDEPFAGLDAVMTHDLIATLDDLGRHGVTLIVATHDVDFARHWADKIIVLREGELLRQGGVTEVLQCDVVRRELGITRK
jgi:cobalt/nickel transport system ATP-binding protein